MRKTLTKTSIILAASMIFAGYAVAQTPAAGTQTPATAPASGTAPTAKAQTGTGSTSGTATKTPAAKTGTATTAHPAFALKTEKDKQSYAIGLNIGGNIAKQMQKDNVDVDPAIMARGMKDALVGAKPLMTDEEVKATLTALTTVLRAKAEAEHKVEEAARKEEEAKLQAEGPANKTAGEAFLAANKAKEGVVTLPSGLQYKILQAGTGPKPTVEDEVICNYKGTLLNGTEFDSSYKRGQPIKISLSHVIKGWSEALQLMPVGSKWELYVPSELAYGAQAPGPPIGANATLVFEVELLSIQPKGAAKPAADGTGAGTAKQ
jgi:FKBP-type peptidyl-prolyl cis-trans isomerase FklB